LGVPDPFAFFPRGTVKKGKADSSLWRLKPVDRGRFRTAENRKGKKRNPDPDGIYGRMEMNEKEMYGQPFP